MSSSNKKQRVTSPGKKKKPHVAVDALSPSLKSSLSINDSTVNPEVNDDDVADMEYPNNNRSDYMSVDDFISGLSSELNNNIIGAEDMVVPSAMAKPSINTDEDIPDINNVEDKAIFICEQFFVSTIFMNCVIKLVTAITEPNSFRKTLQDDTIGTVDLAYDVIKNPSKYEGRGKEYEVLFNKQNKDMGNAIKDNTTQKYHKMINLGHKFSIALMLLIFLHYAPVGCYVDWFNCMPVLQCCIRTMQQSIPRFLWHEYHGKSTDKTFNDYIKSFDMSPFTLAKGTASEIKKQYEELSKMLGLVSVRELFVISFNKMVKHAILYKILYPHKVLRIHVASSWVALYIFGYGSGPEKYCLTNLLSNLVKLSVGLHAQGWLMCMNQSERFFPPDARQALNQNLVDCYIDIIEMDVAKEKRRGTNFVTNIMTGWSIGDKKWNDCFIQVGVMQQLAKAFAVTFGPNEDHWDHTSNLLPDKAKNMFEALKDQNGGTDQLMIRVKRFRITANLRTLAFAIINLPHLEEKNGGDELCLSEDEDEDDPFTVNYFETNDIYKQLSRPNQDLFDNLREKYKGDKKHLLRKLKNMSNTVLLVTAELRRLARTAATDQGGTANDITSPSSLDASLFGNETDKKSFNKLLNEYGSEALFEMWCPYLKIYQGRCKGINATGNLPARACDKPLTVNNALQTIGCRGNKGSGLSGFSGSKVCRSCQMNIDRNQHIFYEIDILQQIENSEDEELTTAQSKRLSIIRPHRGVRLLPGGLYCTTHIITIEPNQYSSIKLSKCDDTGVPKIVGLSESIDEEEKLALQQRVLSIGGINTMAMDSSDARSLLSVECSKSDKVQLWVGMLLVVSDDSNNTYVYKKDTQVVEAGKKTGIAIKTKQRIPNTTLQLSLNCCFVSNVNEKGDTDSLNGRCKKNDIIYTINGDDVSGMEKEDILNEYIRDEGRREFVFLTPVKVTV